MTLLNVVQIATTLIGLLTTVGMSVFLAMIVYMMRRRDNEIDHMGEKVETLEKQDSTHTTRITVLEAKVEGISEIKADIKEIRESIRKIERGFDNREKENC